LLHIWVGKAKSLHEQLLDLAAVLVNDDEDTLVLCKLLDGGRAIEANWVLGEELLAGELN
jgi:hypothetical protein